MSMFGKLKEIVVHPDTTIVVRSKSIEFIKRSPKNTYRFRISKEDGRIRLIFNNYFYPLTDEGAPLKIRVSQTQASKIFDLLLKEDINKHTKEQNKELNLLVKLL